MFLLSENESTNRSNWGLMGKVKLMGKYIALNTYDREDEGSQIKQLSINLIKVGKGEHIKAEPS